jgi:hypothetical protein
MKQESSQKNITLLSPLGLSPGLLYSALMTIKPQQLVVLTSAEGEKSLGSIIQRADYHGFLNIVQIEDPFNCFNQANEKVAEMLELIKYNSCVVNLTGGTTALQFIIQQAGTVLENAGVEVHYVALIDRRDVQKQKENPWVVGELLRVEVGTRQ